MALKNKLGNYLRIVNAEINNLGDMRINWEIFATQDARVDGLGEFETTQHGSMVATADTKQSVSGALRDVVLTLSYNELKKNVEYKDWEDC